MNIKYIFQGYYSCTVLLGIITFCQNTLKISELYLRSSGYLLLILPTSEISVLKDGSYPNENIFRTKLKDQHEIIQEINLTDFFKNSTLFLCKKK